MSAEHHVHKHHVHKLKAEEKSLQSATCGRICTLFHQQGHNKNVCKFTACESHISFGLKDKHHELKRNTSEAFHLLCNKSEKN